MIKNIKTEVKHSNSKFAWNVLNTVLGGKRKIAVVPYIATDIDNKDDPMRKEAFEIAKFISESFNKNP